jgi:hypothetical protein
MAGGALLKGDFGGAHQVRRHTECRVLQKTVALV